MKLRQDQVQQQKPTIVQVINNPNSNAVILNRTGPIKI